MKKTKRYRLNVEKFTNFLILVVGVITLIVIAKTPMPKPTTWQYYDALDQGMSWTEYMASLGGTSNE